MGYGNRDKAERKSGRVGFVEGRLNELRRRWENAKTNARKVSCLNKSASGNHLGRNDPHPPAADGRKSLSRNRKLPPQPGVFLSIHIPPLPCTLSPSANRRFAFLSRQHGFQLVPAVTTRFVPTRAPLHIFLIYGGAIRTSASD